MPTTQTVKFQKLLKIIANENKFNIIQLLTQGEVCVCDIGAKLGIEQSLVSHHLNSLRSAGLINDRKLGSWVHCSLNKKEFSKLSKMFFQHLSPEVISDNMCSIHDECKCLINLPKGEKSEK